MKIQIESFLQGGDIAEARRLLDKYKTIHPKDTDIIVFETEIALQEGDLDCAEQWARKGTAVLPTSADMHYNLACVLEQRKQYYETIKEYSIASCILDMCGEAERIQELGIEECQNAVITEWSEVVSASGDIALIEQAQKQMQILEERTKQSFGIRDRTYRNFEKIIGRYLYEDDDVRRYVGSYFDQLSDELLKQRLSLIEAKGEFLQVQEGESFIYANEERCLLPIATEEASTILGFSRNGENIIVNQRAERHFQYYRLEGVTKILANGKCFFGKPVLLQHNEKRKKLILNIFLDGLAQVVIQDDGLERLMPNTYRFFKKGTVCGNTYSTAEWTYPSIAAYVTSTNTVDHMMFHNIIDTAIRKDVKTLGEYFEEAGYYTAMFNGDWRITPQYGHARGYQRYVYHHANRDFKIGGVIHETIGHIETFRDTDQFVWMSIGDLHDIADGFYLTPQVMKNLDIAELQYEELGETSVKQPYSSRKREMYLQQIRYADFWLSFLYRYIEDNFNEQDILISLFADHGQGYLVPTDGPFMSKERCQVAFMFRGANVPEGYTDELMSTCDYLPIMCNLAGIPLCGNPIDGRLPVWFGGEGEREFAYAESLHPNDPYYAAVYTKEMTIHFESEGTCNNEGKFRLGDYSICAMDQSGNIVEAPEIMRHYEGIILEHIAPLLIY